ncbi:putative ankyrin repeat protein [Planoprotostelium fungivorum]|uniref:Putative ankyrin repeat protein n=1 Tax=Planoprotostelium fungivorum TaxID=1890364 RepID=A0A2P6NEG7_9EUKA|nr:putative ankyrin repeat protein [Planoprotostelium fungivorum]
MAALFSCVTLLYFHYVTLHFALNRGVERNTNQLHQNWILSLKSHDRRRQQYAILRSTCKLWKDLVDGFTDWLNDDDLSLAVKGCKVDSVRFLLSRREVNPSAWNNTSIRLAAMEGHTEVIRLLLSHPRVDPSAQDNDAILIAVYNDHTEIVRLLLSHPRVDPSMRNNRAILAAAKNGTPDMVRLLLSHPKVDPSVDNNRVIRECLQSRWDNFNKHNHVETYRILLRVDPSAGDNEVIRQQPEELTK